MRIKLSSSIGLYSVYTGVAILALSYITGLTRYNAISLLGLLLIIIGVVAYIFIERHKGKY